MHKVNQAPNSLISTGFNQTLNVSFSSQQLLKFNLTILDDSNYCFYKSYWFHVAFILLICYSVINKKKNPKSTLKRLKLMHLCKVNLLIKSMSKSDLRHITQNTTEHISMKRGWRIKFWKTF